MHGRSRMTTEALASLQCRDGARRVFTDQADIANTKRAAPWGVRLCRMKGEPHPTKHRLRGQFLCSWIRSQLFKYPSEERGSGSSMTKRGKSRREQLTTNQKIKINERTKVPNIYEGKEKQQGKTTANACVFTFLFISCLFETYVPTPGLAFLFLRCLLETCVPNTHYNYTLY